MPGADAQSFSSACADRQAYPVGKHEILDERLVEKTVIMVTFRVTNGDTYRALQAASYIRSKKKENVRI